MVFQNSNTVNNKQLNEILPTNSIAQEEILNELKLSEKEDIKQKDKIIRCENAVKVDEATKDLEVMNNVNDIIYLTGDEYDKENIEIRLPTYNELLKDEENDQEDAEKGTEVTSEVVISIDEGISLKTEETTESNTFLDEAFTTFMNEVDSLQKSMKMKSKIPQANDDRLKTSAKRNVDFGSAESQCIRLISQNFISPFQTLQLSPEATDDDIKRHYRKISLLIHPDKCNHPKAREAFQIITKAYTDAQKPEARLRFKNVIEEAKKRIFKDISVENKRRKKMGKELLSENEADLQVEITSMCEKILLEQKERREYAKKCRAANEMYTKQQQEKQREEEEAKLLQRRQWEKNRDTRVSSWREFQGKVLEKKIKVNAFSGIRVVKELRPDAAKKIKEFDDSYKENWR